MAKRPTKIIEIDGPWKKMCGGYVRGDVTYNLMGRIRTCGDTHAWPTSPYSVPAYTDEREQFLAALQRFLREMTVIGATTFIYVRLFLRPGEIVHVYRGTPEEVAVLRMTHALEDKT